MGRPMGVTIRQIAEVAGVSRGTVDRALNGRKGIRPDIAQRICEIAAELGYKPNYAAKILSDRQYTKQKVGIILVVEHNAFYDEILSGAKAALAEYEDLGMENIIHIQQDYFDSKQQIEVMESMVAAGVKGIVMNPINCDEVAEEINKLTQQGVEIVTVNSDIPNTNRMAYVGCHHKRSGAVLAGLLGLMADGRKMKVGVIAGPKYNYAIMRRKMGLLETLEESYANIQVSAIYENENNENQSYNITEELLREHQDLDVLCVLGAGMIGSLKAVQEIQRPVRLKVIMYDMIPEVQEGLRLGIVDATITQEPFRQGYDSVQLIAKYVAYGKKTEEKQILTKLAIVTKDCLDEEEEI